VAVSAGQKDTLPYEVAVFAGYKEIGVLVNNVGCHARIGKLINGPPTIGIETWHVL